MNCRERIAASSAHQDHAHTKNMRSRLEMLTSKKRKQKAPSHTADTRHQVSDFGAQTSPCPMAPVWRMCPWPCVTEWNASSRLQFQSMRLSWTCLQLHCVCWRQRCVTRMSTARALVLRCADGGVLCARQLVDGLDNAAACESTSSKFSAFSITARAVLRRRAELLANSSGSATTYQLSQEVDHLPAFISHNWSVSRRKKWVALSVLQLARRLFRWFAHDCHLCFGHVLGRLASRSH